ncbi:MAG: hypothetical protein HUJ26_09575 [Planctomycetaceae bacterium]|nr:hypothetical protein [Planctomycetaceae bacterium]
MMSQKSRSRIFALLCGFLVLLVTANPGDAQNGGGPSTPSVSGNSSLPNGDIIYLKDQNGRPVPVPKNASVEEYLNWLEKREAQNETRIPDYDLISLSLKGVATEKVAELEAVVALRIRKKEGAVRVPLQFNEAVLKQISHSGEGDFAFIGLNNKTGYEWNISGAGIHEITLKLSVPLTRQLPLRRLQLTVPQSPVSSLELTVGVPNASFKLPQRSAFEITPAGQQTLLTLFGLTENLDLSWQSAPESNSDRSVLEANTRIDVKLSYGNVILTTRQQIEAVSGNFDQLQIRLPEDYQLQNLQVGDELLESVSAVKDRQGWYELQLSAPTSGPVVLDWILSRPIPDLGELVKIEGFEIEGDLRQQSGQIHLAEMSGYRLLTRNQPRALFRIDVPESAGASISRSWEFYRQPFQLAFELQKIRPLYSLEPVYELNVEEEGLVWKADLELNVFRGALSELNLQWPNWQSAGWQLGTELQDGIVDRIRVDENDPDLLQLVFIEPLTAGKKRLLLTARKPFSYQSGSLAIQLPRFPAGSEPADTSLKINSVRNYEVEVGTTADVRSLPPTENVSETESLIPVASLRFPETASRNLELSVKKRQREVTTQTRIRLEYGRDSSDLKVNQALDYQIKYEELDTLRFRIPQEIAESLVVRDSEGRLLKIEFVSPGEYGQARIALSEPLLGLYSLQFDYDLPFPESTNPNGSSWRIPVIQSSDAESKSLRLELGKFLMTQYHPDPEGWQMATNPGGGIYYQSNDPAVRQEIRLQQSVPENQSQELFVRRALHLASTDGLGALSLRSEYLIAGSPDSLQIRIPDGYQLDQLLLDGEPVDDFQLVENLVEIGPSRVDRRLASREHHLSILTNTQSPDLEFGWVAKMDCNAPEILNVSWQNESMWLVELPYRHHLFLQPVSYSPLYTWQREGLFWVRTPNLSKSSLAEWIDLDPAAFEQMFVVGGNSYLFHRLGDGSKIVLGSMHRSMVVLTGAGLTLMISFILLRIPTTRNALTLLMIALALAVAGVFYPTSVALLLQPAILGFCLACLAAFLDNLFRRPQLPNAVITFDEPSRGSSQHTQVPHPSLAQMEPALGSEDPTELRAREVTEEQVSSFISDGE